MAAPGDGGRLVDFVIIGAMKASTTSLLGTLGQHPDVVVSTIKEAQYFVDEVGGRRGPEWYRSLFPDAGPGSLRGEASPQYTFFPFYTGVPERLRAEVPDVRLVYLVRDPVDRLVSHYRHGLANGAVTEALRPALLRDARLQLPSRYWLQLERYFRGFDEEQVLVVDSQRLVDDPEPTLRRVCAHIGADPDAAPRVLARLNVTEDRGRPTRLARAVRGTAAGRRIETAARRRGPGGAVAAWDRLTTAPNERITLDDDLVARLRPLFADDVRHLAAHLGDDAPAWAADY